MDNKNEHKGPKETVWEHLKNNARKLSMYSNLDSICDEYGIDERDAWEYLSMAEIDDEYKDEIQEACKRKAGERIKAIDIIQDGPAPGMTIDQVRELFKVITDISEDARYNGGYWSAKPITHLQDRGIRPDMVNEISEIMTRLCRYIKHRIPWDLDGYIPAPNDPSSIMAPIDPDVHIESWIREHEFWVLLETKPGRYESAKCTVIFDETASLVSRTRAIALPHPQASEGVMDGIAKAFENWFETDDRTLTCIIRHHRLPEGQNRVSYRGRFKADAVRFADAVGMSLGELNACFIAPDGKDFKRNALAKKGISGAPNYKDKYKDSGIYVPLQEFGILE